MLSFMRGRHTILNRIRFKKNNINRAYKRNPVEKYFVFSDNLSQTRLNSTAESWRSIFT